MERRKTRQIKIGPVAVGGDAPISVQSMTNTDTRNPLATLDQIGRLHEAGCEIIRVAVPDAEASVALARIVAASPLPVIADIHFDYKLALDAVKSGVQGLRLNPGNIGGPERVREVVAAARDRGIPIRIGVNAGSLPSDLREKYGHATPEAMVEAALRHVDLLEKEHFHNIKISLKSSDVPVMVEAYQILGQKVDYPFHIGVTEAGTVKSGTIKSSVGISALLTLGLGDTVRVSLTGDPVEEVKVAYAILNTLKLRQRGATLVSCPTCGRCEIDLIPVAEAVEERLAKVDKPLTVAVMGCVVNGPGEAREADVGVAGGKGVALLFKKGEVVKKIPEKDMVDVLLREIEEMERE